MTLNEKIEHWLSDSKAKHKLPERPFITLSYAQSWDGSITMHSGKSLALSGAASTRLTHNLRSLHDGILVGIGTVLADNPQLNVRQWSGPNPQPIILDSHLRIPAAARLCHLADKRCWVLSSLDGASMAGTELEIITLDGDKNGRVCLHTAMRELKKRGISSLMVEGGAKVITAFLRERLADAVVLTVAPVLVGGYKAVSDLGVVEKAELPGILPLFTEKLDEDVIMWGNLNYQDDNA